jgi:hypothetical protein
MSDATEMSEREDVSDDMKDAHEAGASRRYRTWCLAMQSSQVLTAFTPASFRV